MTEYPYTPALQPTFYFIGVTTGSSSIMKVFPAWADYLGLDADIRGIDCRIHDQPSVYQSVVSNLKRDPKALGALVTTHKIDLLAAAGDQFDHLDRYAELLGEVSSISKRERDLWGHAKDPITSSLSLRSFLPKDHWNSTGATLCILGAGGSSLALTAWLMLEAPEEEQPPRIVVTNRSEPRLSAMKKIHERINPGISTEYVLCPSPVDNDRVVDNLAPASLVVNATGLGKDAPGSPVTDAVIFPQKGLVWEFNYRGKLDFLMQAGNQKEKRSLTLEDGWTYFVHGWTRVIAEVFHIEIPTEGPEFDRLCEIAGEARRA